MRPGGTSSFHSKRWSFSNLGILTEAEVKKLAAIIVISGNTIDEIPYTNENSNVSSLATLCVQRAF